MGQDDDLSTSLAHIVLCCVAGNGVGRGCRSKNFTDPGMHTNLFVHGVVGFFHFNSALLGDDLAQAYAISLAASRYLPLACLNADLYCSDTALSTVHVLSGLVPFALAISGNDNPQLGNLMIAVNIISLTYYSLQRDQQWGLFTACAGAFTYFMAPPSGVKVLYPLGLALMEYCAYRIYYGVYSDAPPPSGRRGRQAPAPQR